MVGNRTIQHDILIKDYMGGYLKGDKKNEQEFEILLQAYEKADAVIFLMDIKWLLSYNDDVIRVYSNFIHSLDEHSNSSSIYIPRAVVLTHCDDAINPITNLPFVDRALALLAKSHKFIISLLFEWPLVPLALSGLLLFWLSEQSNQTVIDFIIVEYHWLEEIVRTKAWDKLFSLPNIYYLLTIIVLFFYGLYSSIKLINRYHIHSNPLFALIKILFFPFIKARELTYIGVQEAIPLINRKCDQFMALITRKELPQYNVFAISIPTSPAPKNRHSKNYVPLIYSLKRSWGITNPIDHCIYWSLIRNIKSEVQDRKIEGKFKQLYAHFRRKIRKFRRYGCRLKGNIEKLRTDTSYYFKRSQATWTELQSKVDSWCVSCNQLGNSDQLKDMDARIKIQLKRADELDSECLQFNFEDLRIVIEKQKQTLVLNSFDLYLERVVADGIDEITDIINTTGISHSLIGILNNKVEQWNESLLNNLIYKSVLGNEQSNLVESYLKILKDKSPLLRESIDKSTIDKDIRLSNVVEMFNLMITLPNLYKEDHATSEVIQLQNEYKEIGQILIKKYLKSKYVARLQNLTSNISFDDKNIRHAVTTTTSYLRDLNTTIGEINNDYRDTADKFDSDDWKEPVNSFFKDKGSYRAEFAEKVRKEMQPIIQNLSKALKQAKKTGTIKDCFDLIEGLSEELDVQNLDQIGILAKMPSYSALEKIVKDIQQEINKAETRASWREALKYLAMYSFFKNHKFPAIILLLIFLVILVLIDRGLNSLFGISILEGVSNIIKLFNE